MNGSLFVSGGFNSKVSRYSWKITPPRDACGMYFGKAGCLAAYGCSWCQATVLPNNGSCYHMASPSPYPCNSTISNPWEGLLNATAVPNNATNITIETNSSIPEWSVFPGIHCNASAYSRKPCSTYHSCMSCLATLPGSSGTNCHWCLNQGCRDVTQACYVIRASQTSVSTCVDQGCEASSCENCGGISACFWTRHYLYVSETSRQYSSLRIFGWNCFRASLAAQTTGVLYDIAPPFRCPAKCFSFKNCQSCAASQGMSAARLLLYFLWVYMA